MERIEVLKRKRACIYGVINMENALWSDNVDVHCLQLSINDVAIASILSTKAYFNAGHIFAVTS